MSICYRPETSRTAREQYCSPQVTATITVNLANGNYQRIVLSAGSQTLTVSGQQGGGRYLLKIVQPSSSFGTLVWPANFKWAGGVAPTLTTTSNYSDLISMSYDSTGNVFDVDISPNHSN